VAGCAQPVFAGAAVTLDANGDSTFTGTVSAAALGQALTVELVESLAPMSIGAVGGPVPSGEGSVPVWPLVVLVLRRMSEVGVRG
jgi:hypothetical protein